VTAPASASAGATMTLAARVTNRGNFAWPCAASGTRKAVAVGVQLLGADHSMIDRDYFRHPLPADVQPGGSVPLRMTMPAPDRAGACTLKIDQVVEGQTWFEPRGSRIALVPLRIE
jgi:hypothetical protein